MNQHLQSAVVQEAKDIARAAKAEIKIGNACDPDSSYTDLIVELPDRPSSRAATHRFVAAAESNGWRFVNSRTGLDCHVKRINGINAGLQSIAPGAKSYGDKSIYSPFTMHFYGSAITKRPCNERV